MKFVCVCASLCGLCPPRISAIGQLATLTLFSGFAQAGKRMRFSVH
jgi:hypothetical protein